MTNDVSAMVSEVGVESTVHVAPPSLVSATSPPGPLSVATAPEVTRSREKPTGSWLPAARKVAPPSLETAGMPCPVTVTACVGLANAAAVGRRPTGVTSLNVEPSVVR